MIWVLKHVFFKGHSVRVNRMISKLPGDSDKGWLYTCECGEGLAR